uniref:Triacylglycerol lipase n=1 Tax=Plectus sambesii TaxID=2011161 RepID=A0A914XI39_9BILA
MALLHHAVILIILQLIYETKADFTPDFKNFLVNNFGADVEEKLARRDMGEVGSFGGKESADDKLENQPVVFVHGVSDFAGNKMKGTASNFVKRGRKWSEMYGTTYANGPQGNPLKFLEYSMKCEYVKQVRALIVAVRLYTGRSVDVLGFSLGVPISRKAILGGKCVDTGEYLGEPLTKYIDTYVGVAGPNHGIKLTIRGVGLPACALAVIPVCSNINGLYSGICPSTSRYLEDINAVSGYEGRYRYTIFSKSDQFVGYTVCGKETSAIDGQTQQFVYENQNHDRILSETHDLQAKLTLEHKA